MIFTKPANAKPRAKRGDPEHQMQVALFKWARIAANLDPRLLLLFAVPNGGHRDKRTAARLSAEGVKPGVPDVCLPVAVGKYPGLWLELKAGKNKPSDLQEGWILRLRAQGHSVHVVHDDWDKARAIIEAYLKNL
jgi:hypothetical protein